MSKEYIIKLSEWELGSLAFIVDYFHDHISKHGKQDDLVGVLQKSICKSITEGEKKK